MDKEFKEFKELKKGLKNMKSLILPDYDRPFLLRTDACNEQLGAVLLQQTKEEQWAPVQWVSKKLTPTEKRYGISEKEMLAVQWGIKKFEYELRGRKFTLETNHKALEEIRKKPYFNNNRINRWVEQIQEFDFVVRYKRGEEMIDADAISRCGTVTGERSDRGEKIKTTKWENT